MSKKLNKNTIFLSIIVIVSLASGFFVATKVAMTLFLLLFLIYLFVTKKYMFKVFKGIKAYKLEDYKTALDYYRDAAMSPWCSAPIITNYLICELKHGKTSLANEYATENLKIKNFKPTDALNLEITKSIVLWKNGSREDSINTLKDLLKNNKNSYLYETLTSLLLCSGRFIEAKEYVSEAMEFNKDSNIIKSNYAEVCYKLGKYTEAKEVFDSLIEENIHFIEPFYYSALMEGSNGNYEKAIDLLRTAEGLNHSLVSLISHKDIEQALNSIMVKSLNAID